MRNFFHNTRRTCRIIVGFILLIAGVALVLMPIISFGVMMMVGLLLIYMGASLLADDFPWALRLKARTQQLRVRHTNKLRHKWRRCHRGLKSLRGR